MLLKPSADTKAAAGLVESRNRNGCGKMEAVEFHLADPWSVLPIIAATEQRIGKRVECIALDEGQFVQDLFLFTKRLLDSGYDVMVSGLELDFRGHAVRRNARSLVAGARPTRETSRSWWPIAVAGPRRSIRSGWLTANQRTTRAPSSWPATTTSRAARSTSCCREGRISKSASQRGLSFTAFWERASASSYAS